MWGWLGAPEVGLLKLAQGPVIRKATVDAHVVQESIMPVRHLGEGVKRFDKWFGVYPLLVFPIKIVHRGEKSGFLHPDKSDLIKGKDFGIYVDLGAYGVPREVKNGLKWNAKKNVREMEHWTRKINGFQAIYTDIFCTRKEFRQTFDHSLLDSVRQRVGIDAEDAFTSVYDKTKSRYVDLSEEREAEGCTESSIPAPASSSQGSFLFSSLGGYWQWLYRREVTQNIAKNNKPILRNSRRRSRSKSPDKKKKK